ncbi:hypothetical protein LOTGIDRAFT_233761 [Lottia gigantea]|uniref:Uncharacterized protein n=1 Tax=Lottia gigantea TaxID=225164 RepID=V4A1E5_LOTGI|nr:hypothetical protein LOTGIDRAFT_233761 [Lottia gigantea]ESO90472.1 hypothetical protein LOTGIDRAFT_233761 [Lottia gigantea]
MAFSMINFLKEDVRLMKYENQIYKIKISFEEEQKLADFVPKFSQKEAHQELEQVIRAVLCAVDKKQNLNKIQSDKFVVNVKTKPWGTSQKLGFRQNGMQVPSYPFMIILNVTVKDLDEDDVSIDEEICVQNETLSKSNSNKNLKNTSTAINSNVRVSEKRLPGTESNTKTANKANHHQHQKEKVLSTNVETNTNTDDVLSTQDICDLLDQARQLNEVENLEALQQERKERKAKEDLERFATKYAQKVVKETEKTQKLPKNKIYNVPQKIVFSPGKKKISDSSSISESCSPKINESQRQSVVDERQVTSPEVITGNSESSADESCETSELENRKRKLSEPSQSQNSQSEGFPEKRGRGRPRKLDQASLLALKEQKKAAKKKYVVNPETRNLMMLRRIVESSDESEKKRLRLRLPLSNQIRKSPRIQQKGSKDKWSNKNNSARNSAISVNKLRSTRRDRHLIEQDELAEDMKLQQLAKSSPKHRTSSRVKRQSSTLWDYIVSPVKSIFS